MYCHVALYYLLHRIILLHRSLLFLSLSWYPSIFAYFFILYYFVQSAPTVRSPTRPPSFKLMHLCQNIENVHSFCWWPWIDMVLCLLKDGGVIWLMSFVVPCHVVTTRMWKLRFSIYWLASISLLLYMDYSFQTSCIKSLRTYCT